MRTTPSISIVSPVYYGENVVKKLVHHIEKYVSLITDNFDIILVEDNSPDQSWSAIEDICKHNIKVKGIKLSRNFGQHYAITAGLEHAKGEWVIVMDCDLQDRPDQIEKLFAKTKEGFDIILARRVVRQDSPLKRLSSRIFYKVFGYLTDTYQDPTVANFGVYHKNVVQAILSMKDHIRYFPTMTQWVGFNKTYVDVKHGEREEGSSTYSWKSLFKLAFNNIIAFSTKPLRMTVQLGLTISIISAIIGVYYLINYSLGNITVTGFTSLIISLWFLAGIIIFILGIIGIYLGKVFEKVKSRPVYIIEKELNI